MRILSLFFEPRETIADGSADDSTSIAHGWVLQKLNNLTLCYRPGPARPGHYLLWLGLPWVPSLPVEYIRRGEAVCGFLLRSQSALFYRLDGHAISVRRLSSGILPLNKTLPIYLDTLLAVRLEKDAPPNEFVFFDPFSTPPTHPLSRQTATQWRESIQSSILR